MIGTHSEEALLAHCRAGDHAAFAELIEQNSTIALRTIRAIAPNPADVDDIMQETLLNAYKGLHCFNGQCKFSTWLTRIAINNALSVLRRQKRRMEIPLEREGDEGEMKMGQFPDVRMDPEAICMQNETETLLRSAMNTLPVHLRQYACGRFLDGRSHEEVSSSLGISVAAGKSRSMRARQRLEIYLSRTQPRPV